MYMPPTQRESKQHPFSSYFKCRLSLSSNLGSEQAGVADQTWWMWTVHCIAASNWRCKYDMLSKGSLFNNDVDHSQHKTGIWCIFIIITYMHRWLFDSCLWSQSQEHHMPMSTRGPMFPGTWEPGHLWWHFSRRGPLLFCRIDTPEGGSGSEVAICWFFQRIGSWKLPAMATNHLLSGIIIQGYYIYIYYIIYTMAIVRHSLPSFPKPKELRPPMISKVKPNLHRELIGSAIPRC